MILLESFCEKFANSRSRKVMEQPIQNMTEAKLTEKPVFVSTQFR
jgi:hypothetical protein